jgi:hypothetical protein
MTITSGECLFVIILVAAFIGLWRGWIREVITTAILLGIILFLLVGGNAILYRFLFVNLVTAFKALFEGNSVSVAASPPPQPTQGDLLFNLSTFTALTGISYLVGHKAGKPPTTNTHRLTGIIPGIVNGVAVVFYVVAHIFQMPSSLNVEGPNAATVTSYVPAIFGLAILSVIVVLIVLTTKKAKK